MGRPAAKTGDQIVNEADIHIVLVPNPGGAVPTPQPFPFSGSITLQVSANVRINSKFAAIVGSMANNVPPHVSPDGPFQTPPSNVGRVVMGSATVHINKKAAARAGDICETCHDVPPVGPQAPPPMIEVAGVSNVMIG